MTMRPLQMDSPRSRRGVALLATLVALLLLSILVAAVTRLVTGDFRRARDEGTMRSAADAADAGAYSVMRDWASRPHESVAVGGVLGPDTLRLTSARVVTRTMRTSNTAFWTVSESESGDSLSHTLSRRLANVAYRLAIPDLIANAALTVRDSITLAGSARVVGADTSLTAWGASCGPLAPGAAVAMRDTTRLCDGGCGRGSLAGRATGAPPLLADSSAADTSRYRVFGGERWGTLTLHAAVSLPPGSVVTPAPVVASGACDRSRADNWGDPSGAGLCGTYAPLIWARGDVELRGGVGQGVLLAEGDVTLSAGARFVGVVIARDDLMSTGIGGTVLGAALAGDERQSSGDHTSLAGSTLVRRSSCAIALAFERSARLIPVRARAWAVLR